MRILSFGLIGILFVLCSSNNAAAQQGSVTGTVNDRQSGELLTGINVGVEGTRKGGSTDEDGQFQIKEMAAGNYTLVFSAVGYAEKKIDVRIREGQQTVLEVILEPGLLELQEVEIIGRSDQSYKNDYSFAATKTATLTKNIPQAISVVTKELLVDQQAYRLSETAKNISGMNQFSGYNDLVMRGFRSGSGNDRLLNGLRGGFGFWNQPLTPHLERVEVIKGPASALFANTNPGGTVNMVTKKPLEINKQSLGFTTGSFNTYRATADFTGPMNEERSLLYRLNLGYEDAGSFRTLQFNDTHLIAPSISFIPSAKTRVNVDMVYSHNKTRLDRGQPIFNQSDDLTSTPVEFSLSQPSDYMDLTDFYVTASLNHEFSENLSLNVSYLKFKYNEDLEEHRTSNAFLPGDSTMLQMGYIRRQQEQHTNSLSTYLVSKLRTGAVQHKMLLGFDYIQIDDNRTQIGARGDDFFIADGDTTEGGGVANFDLENPTYTIERNPETYTANWISQPWQKDPTRTYTYGVYLQNQMEIGDRLQVLLGLRQEFYTNRLNSEDGFEYIDQNKLLPRAGVVYSISDQVNAYGTYTEGFEPQDAVTLQDPEIYGGPFDPLTSRMVEGGFKTELFNKRLLASLALYQITQNNILVSANTPGNPNLLEQRGQERSRGFEIDMSGSLTRYLALNANYAFNVAEITESDDESIIGRIKENAPRHQGGLWVKYTFSEEGALSGIGLSAGTNFVAGRNTFERSLQLPGYTVFDAAVHYTVNRFKIAVNVNNVFDKTYWEGGYNYGRIYPGEPRHFLANISYSF